MKNEEMIPENQPEVQSQNAEHTTHTRREFLGKMVVAVPSLIAIPQIFSIKALADDGMVDKNDPVAKALGYSPDAKKVDVKKWPKRAGPEGAKQFCWKCALFQAKDPKNPQPTEIAACAVLSMKKVNGGGWCNSWAPNPNVKA